MLRTRIDEKTYTINEVMEKTGFTRRTTMSHIKQRKLIAYRIGNEYKVIEIELTNYINTIRKRKKHS